MIPKYELIQFKEPSRYIGNEINSIKKDWDENKIKFALVFPDLYEVGMSYTGYKILYNILNLREDVIAERVFAPFLDFGNYLKKNNIPLYTLENKKSLKEFDIIGFTLQYEMTYTNILYILDLAKIPFYSKDRENFPLIIGGGPCAFNPEPVVPFFDLFFIGEAEEAINEIIEILKETRNASKVKKIKELSKVKGVYVPYKDKEGDKTIVRKRVINDLNKVPYPTSPIVPFCNIIHDRVSVEIFRGCSRGCRFCFAGMIYRPVRERSIENIISICKESIKNTGYEELSLVSLSSCDYSNILQIMSDLSVLEEKKVSISLPSLRIDNFKDNQYIDYLSKVRKSGLTFAPEAGTERLRKVINKYYSNNEIFEVIEKLVNAKWKNLKLYFMIGLPSERDEDVQEIIKIYKEVKSISKRSNLRIVFSISSFVPKPHTPFQWEPQFEIGELKEKKEYLYSNIKKDFKWQQIELSFLEAVFSMGDNKLSDVLIEAYNLGCKFDAWTEQFDFEKWMRAFDICGIDPHYYANRKKEYFEKLPWDNIYCVDKEFLIRENMKSRTEEITPDCREKCSNCGVCFKKGKIAE